MSGSMACCALMKRGYTASGYNGEGKREITCGFANNMHLRNICYLTKGLSIKYNFIYENPLKGGISNEVCMYCLWLRSRR